MNEVKSLIEFKNDIINEVEEFIEDEEPDTIEKGNRFMNIMLRYLYDISEDKANMLVCGQRGDGGIDATHLSEDNEFHILQSKYLKNDKTEKSKSLTISDELRKTFETLEERSKRGLSDKAKDNIKKFKIFLETSVSKFSYIFIIPEKLSKNDEIQFSDNIAGLNIRYNNRIIGKTYSIEDAYEYYKNGFEKIVDIKIKKRIDVHDDKKQFLGIINTLDFERFLKNYADNYNFDTLFDSNIRRDLKNKNLKISDTLDKIPERMFAFHNGITIASYKVDIKNEEDIQLTNPNILNGAQTGYNFYNYFKDRIIENLVEKYNDSYIPIKIIEERDEDRKNEITLSTNTQSAVKEIHKIALDKRLKIINTNLNKKYNDSMRIKKGIGLFENKIGNNYEYTELIKVFSSTWSEKPEYGKISISGREGGKIYDEFIGKNTEGVDHYTDDTLVDAFRAASLLYKESVDKEFASRKSKKDNDISHTRGKTRYAFFSVIYKLIKISYERINNKDLDFKLFIDVVIDLYKIENKSLREKFMNYAAERVIDRYFNINSHEKHSIKYESTFIKINNDLSNFIKTYDINNLSGLEHYIDVCLDVLFEDKEFSDKFNKILKR